MVRVVRCARQAGTRGRGHRRPVNPVSRAATRTLTDNTTARSANPATSRRPPVSAPLL